MEDELEAKNDETLKTSDETFKELPLRRPISECCETAEMYREKNRYSDAVPTDEFRLKINKFCGDYINISKVEVAPDRWLLCGQGPMYNTVYDFWRAVIENSINLIVMLTRLLENGKEKCFQYIPQDSRPLIFSCQDCVKDLPIKICLESQAISDNLSFRTSSLKVSMGLVEKDVTHVQYLKWDDFQTPLTSDLNLLVNLVERYPNCLIHCSAGLGRTGTLIAVVRRKITGENADEAIKHIRKYRNGLVANVEQYRVVKNFC